MAFDLSKSQLVKLQARLNEMISGDTPVKYPQNVNIETAKAMLSNHNARVTEVLQGSRGGVNQKFRAMLVNFLNTGDLTADYDGDGADDAGACTLPEGEASVSNNKEYTNNLWIRKNVETEDDLSENLFEIDELLAERIMAGMFSVRQTLNTRMINFLNSNKTSVNNDANLPDGITFNAGVFDVDPTKIDMKNWRAVTDLDTVMANNRLREWFYISGRYNLYNEYVDSQHLRKDNDKRSTSAYDNMNLAFDIRDLDATLGGRNTFGVGRGTYVFWDRADVPAIPMEVEDNVLEYFIEDDALMVNDNGRMRPLRYLVRMEKTCTGESSVTRRLLYRYRIRVGLLGGLYPAPPSEDSHTGIARFKTTLGG